MWKSRHLGWLVVLGLLALGLAAPVQAADRLRATLDGKPISLDVASTLSCSDVDYPVLTCYRTSAELEAAMAATASSLDLAMSGTALATTSTGYVVVFEHGQYAGAAMAYTHDYSCLCTIGWNDKISSFKSYGASGKFWENAPSGGFIYYFGPTTWVAYVGDQFNDRFSAFYMN
jgi:hypothetical protein